MNEINQIVADIRDGNLKPIYFLMGEEPYYIDKISNYIEDHVLDESEKGFNQVVMYGRDVSVEELIASAKRFPMMAERQVLIVKEAQDLSRTIEKLVPYIENPQPTTVLVINYKYEKSSLQNQHKIWSDMIIRMIERILDNDMKKLDFIELYKEHIQKSEFSES